MTAWETAQREHLFRLATSPEDAYAWREVKIDGEGFFSALHPLFMKPEYGPAPSSQGRPRRTSRQLERR